MTKFCISGVLSMCLVAGLVADCSPAAAENKTPEDQVKDTKLETFKDWFQRQYIPSSIEELREVYEADSVELAFLLAVRKGNENRTAELLESLDFTTCEKTSGSAEAGESSFITLLLSIATTSEKDNEESSYATCDNAGMEIADAWGYWQNGSDPMLSRKIGQGGQAYILDPYAYDFIQESYLQARVGGNRKILVLLEPLIAKWLTSKLEGTMFVEDATFIGGILGEVLDPRSILVSYRFPDGTEISEEVLCALVSYLVFNSSGIELALEAGANPDAQCVGGYSPLTIAAILGDRFSMEDLLRFGADPNRKSRGYSPLATLEKSPINKAIKAEMRKLLIEAGARH